MALSIGMVVIAVLKHLCKGLRLEYASGLHVAAVGEAECVEVDVCSVQASVQSAMGLG
jgi:hypothetical protein